MADFLLCTFELLVFFVNVANCVLAFKTPEEIEQLKRDLLNDPFDRFVFTEENGNLLIGLKYLTESGRRIQQAVENWRVRILHFLERAKSPVELGRIAVHVARPDSIPTSFKLKDILNADKLGRFSVHGTVDRLLVSRNISAQEIEESRQLWRDQCHHFLFAQPRDVTLAVLGNNVPRPGILPKHENKLIEVLNGDPERRFFFMQRSPAETMVRVKLTEGQREQLSEVWRMKVENYLLLKGCEVLLSEIGANVKRPSVHFGTVTTLRELLLNDPYHRFHLFGSGLMMQVVLTSSVRDSPQQLPKPPPVLPLHKGYHNDKISERTEGKSVPFGARADNEMYAQASFATNGAAAKPVASVRYGEPVPPARYGQTASQSGYSPGHRHQHSAPPHFNEYSLHGALRASSAPDYGAMTDTKGWDVVQETLKLKNLSDDFSDLFCTPTQVEKPQFPGRSDARGSSLPPPASAVSDNVSEARPSTFTLLPQSSLLPPSQSSKESSVASSHSMHKRDVDLLLSEWLPVVLLGFGRELVDATVEYLHEDGYSSVRDLVVARNLGQLSPDYLAQIGLKMGHCNRIFAQLPTNI